MLLRGHDNDVRAAFDVMCEQRGLRYQLRAEVDDMALLRLLARSDSAPVGLANSSAGLLHQGVQRLVDVQPQHVGLIGARAFQRLQLAVQQ